MKGAPNRAPSNGDNATFAVQNVTPGNDDANLHDRPVVCGPRLAAWSR